MVFQLFGIKQFKECHLKWLSETIISIKHSATFRFTSQYISVNLYLVFGKRQVRWKIQIFEHILSANFSSLFLCLKSLKSFPAGLL